MRLGDAWPGFQQRRAGLSPTAGLSCLDDPRRRTDGLKCPFKFGVDLVYSVEDIAVTIGR